jgi:hypothetical protein
MARMSQNRNVADRAGAIEGLSKSDQMRMPIPKRLRLPMMARLLPRRAANMIVSPASGRAVASMLPNG